MATEAGFEELLDRLLFAPIGALSASARRPEEFAAAGRTAVRQQITAARFIGKLAVDGLAAELARRMRSATGPDAEPKA